MGSRIVIVLSTAEKRLPNPALTALTMRSFRGEESARSTDREAFHFPDGGACEATSPECKTVALLPLAARTAYRFSGKCRLDRESTGIVPMSLGFFWRGGYGLRTSLRKKIKIYTLSSIEK